MTEQEKDLLLKDLCARLPYGVNVLDDMGRAYKLQLGSSYLIDLFYGNGDYLEAPIRPYLRPLTSMTEEEECEFCRWSECDSVNVMYGYINWVVGGSCDYYDFDIEFSKLAKVIDWLNAHHFDYRGLIEKGLALEAPENMYKHFGDMDVVVTSVEHKDKL